jgi:hypothetical protein
VNCKLGELTIKDGHIDTAAVKALTMIKAPKLTSLELVNNPDKNVGLFTIRSSALATQLKQLRLNSAMLSSMTLITVFPLWKLELLDLCTHQPTQRLTYSKIFQAWHLYYSLTRLRKFNLNN